MKIHKYPEHSSCKGKKTYMTIDQANDVGKNQMYHNPELLLYIYKCTYCDKYHLTQQVTDHMIF